MLDQEVDSMAKVRLVDPGYELPARASLATEPKTHESQQRIENATTIRTHYHCTAQSDFTRLWSGRIEEGFLPTGGHVDAESPACGSVGLIPADFASLLVHRAIHGVAVDSCSAGVHPESRRVGYLVYGLPQ